MATASEKKHDELTKQIDDLKSDVAALTKSLKDLGAAKAKEAKVAVQEQASDGVDQALEYVRDKPANALAVAAGIGFLLGMMSGRR